MLNDLDMVLSRSWFGNIWAEIIAGGAIDNK